MSKVPFGCPRCGHDVLKTKSPNDLVDATCARCGHSVTNSDIRAQAAKLAEKMVRDAFKK